MLELPPIPDAQLTEFDRVTELRQPVVFRGLVSSWPVVAAANASPSAMRSYLLKFDNGAHVEAFVGDPALRGRFFYDSSMRGFNFERAQVPLRDVVSLLLTETPTRPRARIYVGSTPAAQVLPGFEKENSAPQVQRKDTEPRLWIGNETNVAAHFDESDNLACVAAGRRRFVLFPPEQISNLYVGPIDVTVAGPPTSMVDMRNPDFETFPKFREALAVAMTAELEPGDAIYIPALWWHHVEALDPFNMLVNYWWLEGPADAGTAFACIAHGLLT